MVAQAARLRLCHLARLRSASVADAVFLAFDNIEDDLV
jgi:hypothetical protein